MQNAAIVFGFPTTSLLGMATMATVIARAPRKEARSKNRGRIQRQMMPNAKRDVANAAWPTEA